MLPARFRPLSRASLTLFGRSSPLAADKYAHAVVHHGSAAEPYIQDYLIGPLPISNATRLAPLRDIYHVDKIPFHGRGFAGQMLEFREFIQGVMAPLEDASMDLFGAVSRGFLSACRSPAAACLKADPLSPRPRQTTL